jgi:hypothetical protein
MIRRYLLFPLLLLVVLGSAHFTALCADGGKAKNVVYEAFVPSASGDGNWQFSVDTSPIIFYVATVNNKYHVLLIRLKNTTKTPLNLSVEQDSIELRFDDGQKVKGLLNIAGTDRPTWDALEPEIRRAVAYPQVVPAKEEEGIYVYIPVNDIAAARKKHEMPRSIIYHINGQTVELRQRGVAAA